MSIMVTGGAGFIGSCMVRTLNDKGIEDIIIVDNVASTGKWMNLRNKKYREYVHKSLLPEYLKTAKNIEAIVHLGACSATTERDFDYLYQNNFEYGKKLWNYCSEMRIPFLYASSAATYGDGNRGFDDREDIQKLCPLNGYGYSKQLFDLWVKRQIEEKRSEPDYWAGFKFFNVYGPNEYFKGSMASMVYHGYRQARETGKIKLFKSYRPDYGDGEQLRDFVYVKDVCAVIGKFLEKKCVSNTIVNIGMGKAHSFRELAEAIFQALGIPAEIEYIDMPEHLKEQYQYYTKAEISKLREAGYTSEFYDLIPGVADYVTKYLSQNYLIY